MVTEEDTYARLTDIFQDVFADDHLVLTPSLTADDVPGWDSMRMISILVAIEERLGIKFRSREINELQTVGDLAKAIQVKRL